jgi:hypothetical protein
VQELGLKEVPSAGPVVMRMTGVRVQESLLSRQLRDFQGNAFPVAVSLTSPAPVGSLRATAARDFRVAQKLVVAAVPFQRGIGSPAAAT